MAALLLFSWRCKHCVSMIEFIKQNKPLHSIVQLHDVNKGGVPPALRNKITEVPTLVTQDGNFMVGVEVRNWLTSMIPSRDEVESLGFGGLGAGVQSLENPEENGAAIFDLESYGTSLAPPMTPELQNKIDMSVSDAYNAAQSK